MQIVVDELTRSRNYHLRQLEDNLQQIRFKEEAIEVLKLANEKEKEIIEALGDHIEKLNDEKEVD